LESERSRARGARIASRSSRDITSVSPSVVRVTAAASRDQAITNLPSYSGLIYQPPIEIGGN
jgi:hypothetical protein